MRLSGEDIGNNLWWRWGEPSCAKQMCHGIGDKLKGFFPSYLIDWSLFSRINQNALKHSELAKRVGETPAATFRLHRRYLVNL